MKKYIYIIGVMAMAMGTLSSCQDIVDYETPDLYSANGAPEISAIYDATTVEDKNPIEGGELSQMIRLVGKNLSHVKSITFNGIPVDKSHIYAESNKCVVTIPRTTPEVADNKLVYTTELGSTTRDFEVSFPSISINDMENEFAKPGSTVTIRGDFGLYNLGKDNLTVKVGDKECTVGDPTYITPTQTDITITIPQDAPDCKGLDFSYAKPDGTEGHTLVPYRMYQYSVMPVFKNDDGSRNDDLAGWWNDETKAAVVEGTQPGGPEDPGHPYFYIDDIYEAWCWQAFGWKTDWRNADATAHPENYVLKFEMWTDPNHPFPISVNDNANADGFIWSFNDADSYEWNVSRGTKYNTNGKWITQTLSLEDVAKNGLMQVLDPTQQNFMNVNFVLQPCDEENDWELQFAIANIRIQPKNLNK